MANTPLVASTAKTLPTRPAAVGESPLIAPIDPKTKANTWNSRLVTLKLRSDTVRESTPQMQRTSPEIRTAENGLDLNHRSKNKKPTGRNAKRATSKDTADAPATPSECAPASRCTRYPHALIRSSHLAPLKSCRRTINNVCNQRSS